MSISKRLISAVMSGILALGTAITAAPTAFAATLPDDASAELYDSTNSAESKDSEGKPFDVFGIYNAYQELVPATAPATTSTTTTTVPKTTTAATTVTTTEEQTTTAETTTTAPEVPLYITRRGIDVSKFQNTINWPQVKAGGIDFTIVQAGYGRELYQKDYKFDENVKNAKAAGLDVGVYWYSYANSPEDAVREAETCYEIIKNYDFEYPVYYDVEEKFQSYYSAAYMSQIVDAFCSTIESKGYRAGVYSYAWFLEANIYRSVLDKYEVWVAQYASSPYSFSGEYGVWQYSGTGWASGVPTQVDLNYSYKNYPYILSPETYSGPTGTVATASPATTSTTTTTASYKKGVDISSLQGDIDWGKAKANGVDFAILRAGYNGIEPKADANFAKNAADAAAAGMPIGAYWYATSTTVEGMLKEAEAFYNTIKGIKFDYPLYLDIEDPVYSKSELTPEKITELVKAFCGYFEDKGYYIGIYSYEFFLTNHVDPSLFELYDVWLANYGVEKPAFSSKYGTWQYDIDVSIDGIGAPVSVSYCYRSYPSVMREYHLNGY
ncbi:MAG TPA: GH25 family lysozyme [Ruminococcus sp.]|nr:GH25 family lysozyme [Ruminococcus sp.]